MLALDSRVIETTKHPVRRIMQNESRSTFNLNFPRDTRQYSIQRFGRISVRNKHHSLWVVSRLVGHLQSSWLRRSEVRCKFIIRTRRFATLGFPDHGYSHIPERASRHLSLSTSLKKVILEWRSLDVYQNINDDSHSGNVQLSSATLSTMLERAMKCMTQRCNAETCNMQGTSTSTKSTRNEKREDSKV